MPLTTDSQGRQVVPLVINDKPLPINEDAVYPVTNSKTGETVHYYTSTDIATCDAACEAAWAAFQGAGPLKGQTGWKRATVVQRRNLLNKVADLYEERVEELVRTQMAETACEEAWGRNNVSLAVAYVREIAACVSGIRGVIPPMDKPDSLAFVYKEAVGPVLIIPP